MHPQVEFVNTPLADTLNLTSLRTLYVIAAYHDIPLSRRAARQEVAGLIATTLEAALPTLLISRLSSNDLATLRALCSHKPATERTEDRQVEAAPLLPTDEFTTEIRYPWSLYGKRPPIEELSSLERLMALGFVLPVKDKSQPGASPIKLLLPTNLKEALQEAQLAATPLDAGETLPDLPQAPPLASLTDDVVLLLAALSAQPLYHPPDASLPASLVGKMQLRSAAAQFSRTQRIERLQLLHHLLHFGGYLTLEEGRCAPSSAAPAWLESSLADQVELLLQLFSDRPLASTTPTLCAHNQDIAWPALLHSIYLLLADLTTSLPMSTQGFAVPIPTLLQNWKLSYGDKPQPHGHVPPSCNEPPPLSANEQIIKGLLEGPMHLLGLVRLAGGYSAPSTDSLAYYGGSYTPEQAAAPTLHSTTIHFPPHSAALLRYYIEPWATPSSVGNGGDTGDTDRGHTYRFTKASIRRGVRMYGATRHIQSLLRQSFHSIPEPLADLLDMRAHDASVVIAPRLLLEAQLPDTIDHLLANKTARRYLGPRLGPYTVIVRNEAALRRSMQRLGLLDKAPIDTAQASNAPMPLGTILGAGGNAHSEDKLYHLILALRLAQSAAPGYAPAFAELARDLTQHLSNSKLATLDDVTYQLENPQPAARPRASTEAPACAENLAFPTMEPATLRRTLRGILEAGSRLHIQYYSAARDIVSWRTIQPILISAEHLRAYCFKAQDERLFRLDRILQIAAIPGDKPITQSKRSRMAAGGRRSRRSMPKSDPSFSSPAISVLPDYMEDL